MSGDVPPEEPRSGIVDPEEDATVQTIGAFLREAPEMPEGPRQWLALVDAPSLLHGSALGEAVEAGTVPAETAAVLEAALLLRRLGRPAEAFRHARKTLEELRPLTSPEREARETLVPLLREAEAAVRRCEEFLERAGYSWDLAGRRVVTPTGGNPRELYRDLVEALARVWNDREGWLRNDADLRSWISSELAPFFSPDLLDPSPDGKLKATLGNVLRR